MIYLNNNISNLQCCDKIVVVQQSPLRYTLFMFVCVQWCSKHICFVFLYLVYPMLQVHLDCPFFIAPSVFSNVYLRRYVGYHQYPLIALTSDLKINFVFHNIRNVSESLSYDVLRTTKTHLCPSNMKSMAHYSILLDT